LSKPEKWKGRAQKEEGKGATSSEKLRAGVSRKIGKGRFVKKTSKRLKNKERKVH
jgi:hypothetical protein